MKRDTLWVLVLTFSLAMFLAAGCKQESPTGMATGKADKRAKVKELQKKLWTELAVYEDSFLGAYGEYFEDKPDDAYELLGAFSELSFSITGPGGLWRKTVPDKYFGCANNEHLPICQQFQRVAPMFKSWDAFQQQILDVDGPRQAEAFIKQNQAKMREYLKIFVPQDESLTAVQNTPFFQQNLAASL